MEVGLGWLGVGVGAVGFILTFLLAILSVPRENRSVTQGDKLRAWLAAALTLVITLIFWLISGQRLEPFSPGQTLGIGFLIGGLAGVIAVPAAMRLEAMNSVSSPRTGYLSVFSTAFFGLFGVSLTYLIFNTYPQHALIGFSIGAAMAAILHHYLQQTRTGARGTLTELWALFSITVAIAVVFSVYRFDTVTARMWWPLPILIAASLCVAAYLGTEIAALTRLRTRSGAFLILSTAIGAFLALGLTAVYAWRILENWQLFYTTAVGFGIAALIAWLVSSALRAGYATGGLEAAAAVVLLIVAFTVISFTLWAGLGTAVGLLGAWVVILPAAGLGKWTTRPDDTDPQTVVLPYRTALTIISLGLAILLFRLFVEQYRPELRNIDLRINYNFIGALVGAVLPFLFASSLMRLQTLYGEEGGFSRDLPAIIGAAMLGLFAAASPLLLFMIWGIKATLGLLFGFVAAESFMLLSGLPQMAAHTDRDRVSITSYSTGLLVVGAQLVAVQFIRPLIDLELTRTTRIWILLAAVVVIAVWMIINGIAARRRTH